MHNNKLSFALNQLVFYNGYEEIIDELIYHIMSGNPSIASSAPAGIEYRNEDETVRGMFWFIIVCMFGDYGTSPRFGWAEKKSDAIAFLKSMKEERCK